MFSTSDVLQSYMDLNLHLEQLKSRCKANEGTKVSEELREDVETAVDKLNKIRIAEQNKARKETIEELGLLLSKKARGNEEGKVVKEEHQPNQPTAKRKQRSEDSDSFGRQNAIEATIVQPGKIRFTDVAGLQEVKRLLREAIVMPLKYPHLFNGGRKPWRKILLFGPPGTGKSRIARAVSSEVASTFYSVTCSDLLSSWFGETEKLIKDLFSSARRNEGQSIIFIDEIDGLCRRRNSNEQEQTRRIKTELLKQMEGAETQDENNNLFVLGATNCPWELDTAFLRRFEKRIYIPLPDKQTRKELFLIHLKSVPVNITDEEWEKLLELSEGYSGSDLSTCVSDALFEPVRELESSVFWKWNSDGRTVSPCRENEDGAVKIRFESIPADQVNPRPVEFKDLESALTKNHKTVNVEELACYEKFTTFGKIS
eukprot:Seg1617.10 transcript_id=Seg1617.10/GoldUCD/mRNA.D3Y31 product="Vacuolar protein sorting-associated protein 4A" protein_id=Seg1617.10/GoldUCD/D3Y31